MYQLEQHFEQFVVKHRRQEISFYVHCIFEVELLRFDCVNRFYLQGQCSTQFRLIYIFSAPEPKTQVHFCDHALSVVCRPSAVVNFSHFRLLWNHWTEFNETWKEAKSQGSLPSLCFSGRSEKQCGRPGLWLAETFSTSPLKPLNGIQRNFTGSKISTSSTKFVFFGPIGKTRWPPWSLIGWDIVDFSSETAERY